MVRELKTVASNLTFFLIFGGLIDLKVSSNDVKHITRVDCLYVPHTVLLVGATYVACTQFIDRITQGKP